MDISFLDKIPGDLRDDSRVWIYQASRRFTPEETPLAEQALARFNDEWTAHGKKVKGYCGVLLDQFLVLIADETSTGVGGCSIDSSVRVIKEISRQTGVDLFDRTQLAFLDQDKVILVPLSELQAYADRGILSGESLFFNNLVASMAELKTRWLVPLKDSWLADRVRWSGKFVPQS